MNYTITGRATNQSMISLPHISPAHTVPTLPPSLYPNYTITNQTVLPDPVAQRLHQLRREHSDGVLTARGYLKQQAMLMETYQHLVSTAATDQHNGGGPGRKLMMVPVSY